MTNTKIKSIKIRLITETNGNCNENQINAGRGWKLFIKLSSWIDKSGLNY